MEPLRRQQRKSKCFQEGDQGPGDDLLIDAASPDQHVAIFDEAQRAWTMEKTKDFMKRKKKVADFGQSEPHFLISCMDRREFQVQGLELDWAVVAWDGDLPVHRLGLESSLLPRRPLVQDVWERSRQSPPLSPRHASHSAGTLAELNRKSREIQTLELDCRHRRIPDRRDRCLAQSKNS